MDAVLSTEVKQATGLAGMGEITTRRQGFS
jgi:hypothetical protein